MCLVKCKKCQQKTSMYLEICEYCKENRAESPETQACSGYHDGELPTVNDLLRQLAKEQEKNAKLVRALEWIVGYDGNQYTTTKAEQALKENE